MPRNNRPRRRSDAASSGPAVMLSGTGGSASAPRSKAGCWTCRIRRKRCDEQQDDNGSCQACVRLDIECLGWGQRRPDWCRDKDKLTEYKLRLKRKLCSRAGTRPSAATIAARQQQSQPQQSTSQQQRRIDGDNITRAPSGESPSTSYSDDEMDNHRNENNGTGFDEEEETDDSWAFNSAFYASPLYPQSALPPTNNVHTQLPLHPFSPTFTSPSASVSVASVTALSQKLHAHLPNILSKSPLPAEYHTLATQLLDLLSYKAFSSPSSSSTCINAEQEIAQRARKIDEALTRLNNRNAFDGSFESMTGFEFNPITFLTASNLAPSIAGSSVYSASPLVDPYSSPLGMSSPDLIYETFSQFSGSSAPTSPAAPMLAMTASPAMLSSSSPALGVGSPLLYGYQPQAGFDSYQSLNAFSFNASSSSSSSTSTGYDSTPSSASTLSMGMGMTADDGMMMMGALGLSNDFYAQNDYSSITNSSAMTFTLPPPPSTAPAKPMPLITTTTTAPSTPSPSSSAIAQQDSDPLQIHYDSCSLLLQSILSSSSNSSTAFMGSVEETLQRLTSKFSSMITSPSIASSPSMTNTVKQEYLFSATLAGALCPKNSYRRDLFRRVVRGIEERQLGPGGLGEAGLLLDQI